MLKQIVKRNGEQVSFQPEKIFNAIRKAGKDTGEITDSACIQDLTDETISALAHLETEKVGNITVEQIQDVVEQVLMNSVYHKTAKSYVVYRHEHAKARNVISENSIETIKQYLGTKDWAVKENSNMGYSLQGLNAYIAKGISSNFWLNEIYPREIATAHSGGTMHIHDLGYIASYSYFGKETIIVKDQSGSIQVTSFQNLYESLDINEHLLNEKDGAYAKYPKGMWVLDKNGWTSLDRVIKKDKNKNMAYIKNEGGRSVLVTEDHPMLIDDAGTETPAIDVRVGRNKLLTVDLKSLLSNETLFNKDTLILTNELSKIKFAEYFIDGIPSELFNKDVPEISSISTSNIAHDLCNTIKLTEDLGYLVGFYIAEGTISNPGRLSFKIRNNKENEYPVERLKNATHALGCRLYINPIDNDTFLDISIYNTTLIRLLFQKIWNLDHISKDKKLPNAYLEYNINFNKGILAGIIDGDGAINGKTSISIRTASRTMLEQIATLATLIGITPRDRNIEGVGTKRIFNGREIVQRYPLFGVGFRKSKVTLPSYKFNSCKESTQAWRKEEPGWNKVLTNKEAVIQDDYIYDITTESNTLIVNGMWNHNCVGHDLQQLLMTGFRGAKGKTVSAPPKHLRSVISQMVNFIFTMQGEAAGAQAFSNVDTYLAPFVYYDNLSYKEVKQNMQEFIFNLNMPTRSGFQAPFSNITMDLNVPSHMKDQHVIVGGEAKDETYGDFQQEVNMINRAFLEVMEEGDGEGSVLTFPIPTYNITEDFDWDNPIVDQLMAVTGKYGIPYFSNFVNSDMDPEDTRSMCCRLRLDNRELQYKGGGLFGANPKTGSIGVVTLNLPRMAYLADGDLADFHKRIAETMFLAKESLELKRAIVEGYTEKGLYPYTKYYMEDIKQRTGSYWANHFSTIGLVGMNEAIMNLMKGEDITTPTGKEVALDTLEYMRGILEMYQEETGNNYNLEATPAESTAYRLAQLDVEKYPGIITARNYTEGSEDYYTNSVHGPVNYTQNMFQVLDDQDELQVQFTGGTVVHLFTGERIENVKVVKELVKYISNNYRLPYFSITPSFSVCKTHGYISGEVDVCPKCGEATEIYSRVVGYLRPVSQWNTGKSDEFIHRAHLTSELKAEQVTT